MILPELCVPLFHLDKITLDALLLVICKENTPSLHSVSFGERWQVDNENDGRCHRHNTTHPGRRLFSETLRTEKTYLPVSE